jgi:hypothetical protein
MGFPQWSLFPAWLFLLWCVLRELQYKKLQWVSIHEQILNSRLHCQTDSIGWCEPHTAYCIRAGSRSISPSVTSFTYETTQRILNKFFIYVIYQRTFRSRGSSVSIVSGYGLDDRAIEVRSPAGAKDFSSNLCVQTGSGAHPASYTIGTGGPFPGGKARPGRDADHSPPSTAEVENE